MCMGMIVRTIHVTHDNGHLLGGLLHYVEAASNHAAKALRRGVRGKKLYHIVVHRTGVYHSRFADYIIQNVHGNHKAWRTNQLTDMHVRAPHYHNPVAQTDRFKLAFDDTSKRWNGTPSIYVPIYGRGRPDKPWLVFPVPPYVVDELTKPGRTPKTVLLRGNKIYITYKESIPDCEPVSWAGVDMNAKNNTYAFADGTAIMRPNRNAHEYNKAHSRMLKVKRRSDNRIMTKYTNKAWSVYKNRIHNDMCVEARKMANAGYGIGHETLGIHRLYTKNGKTSPFVRGKTKSTLNTGQRQNALKNAAESEGLPCIGIEPRNTSAKCLKCGGSLEYIGTNTGKIPTRGMWCHTCRTIRERDANAGANILFRTILALMCNTTMSSNATLYHITRLLKEAAADRAITHGLNITLLNIMRLLEGRSADAEWHLSGAHKPERQNSVGGEPMGCTGVGDTGQSGPGPPNVAKLCNYA
ncbi:MAG: transposase [Cenarchaeum sp. SB0663_bin_5]|nr:transposase [Cenarchaeum sp. SB0663_bin_5]MYH04461.1 transposase [Cenarchaeum sp. SB0675_bin_21]MYL11191.1 transposase [Cenarchaeum sp. SB0669_bin_11]